MLIVVGIQQGNPLFLKEQNQTYIRHQTFGRPRRSEKKAPKRDLHRKLAPSYIRAYDRLIAYIQANGGEIKSREDGIRDFCLSRGSEMCIRDSPRRKND